MLIRKLMAGSCLAVAMSCAVAANLHVANPADVADVAQIIRLSGTDKVYLDSLWREMEKENRQHPEAAIDLNVFLSDFTMSFADDHLATVYANYMTGEYAKKLIGMLQTPAGKTSIRLSVLHTEKGAAAEQEAYAKLTLTEKKAVNDFRKSNAALSYINAQTNAIPEFQEASKNWVTAEATRRIDRAKHEFAKLFEAELQIEKDDSVTDSTLSSLADRIPRTGLIAFDREMRLSAVMVQKMARLNRRIQHDTEQLGLGEVLKSENLVTSEGLEKGNLLVLTAENVIADHSAQLTAINTDYERGLNEIPMSAQMRQTLMASNNKKNATFLDVQLRQSEHTSNYIELLKQVLTYCEQRLGKTKAENSKIIFSTADDAAGYNTLLAKIRNEREVIQKIEQDDFERRKRAADSIK